MPASGRSVARDRPAKATKPASNHALKVAARELKRHNGITRAHRKLRLLTREHLDGRSTAAHTFNRIIANVTSDLGGQEMLTEIEKHLVVSFAGAALLQSHQVAKLLSGEEIDVDEYSSVTTAMIRSATRLGTQRRQKQVNTPDLQTYLRHKRSSEEIIDAEEVS
jgi:hypothetical protein